MVYRFDRFQLDDDDFRLSASGGPVAIEPKALRLLLYLVRNPQRLITKQELFDHVWPKTAVTDGALTRTVVLLRKALEDDSRKPCFIETVPTAGYRFICTVTVEEPAPTPLTSVFAANAGGTAAATLAPPEIAQGEPAPAPVPASSKVRRSILHIAAIIAIIALAVSGAGWFIEQRLHAARAIRSLAVLPLDNLSGDPTQDYFADGMTDELITELARIPGLRVVSRASIMQLKGARKPLPEIASSLQVDAIVEGSVVRSGDRVRITAQLIDTRSDKHLWAESFEDSSRDILSLQDSVAARIASAARLAISPASLASPRTRPVDPTAHDAYLRGRYFFNKQDFDRSTAAFQQAIDLDPDYASAWAGLATALDADAVFNIARNDDAIPRALAAAKRAIELDSANGEAYTELGSIQTIYQWNWTAAHDNLTRGIELSPSDSLAEFKYATYLSAVGQTEDAVTHMRRAVQLDPLSFIMTRRLGATLYLARHYDEALDVLHRAAEMEPTQGNTYDNYISLIYEMKGNRDEAVAHDLSALAKELHDADSTRLRSTYLHDGWPAYWHARIIALTPLLIQRPCQNYSIGISYLHFGDRDRAINALNQAIDNHCFEVTRLKAEPALDPLRSDARYLALLARINLAP